MITKYKSLMLQKKNQCLLSNLTSVVQLLWTLRVFVIVLFKSCISK